MFFKAIAHNKMYKVYIKVSYGKCSNTLATSTVGRNQTSNNFVSYTTEASNGRPLPLSNSITGGFSWRQEREDTGQGKYVIFSNTRHCKKGRRGGTTYGYEENRPQVLHTMRLRENQQYACTRDTLAYEELRGWQVRRLVLLVFTGNAISRNPSNFQRTFRTSARNKSFR